MPRSYLVAVHVEVLVLFLQMRALLVGAVIGTIFSIIILKLGLTTGIIPSLNIAAGLIGFIAIKGWVAALKYLGYSPHEFTPQVMTLSQSTVIHFHIHVPSLLLSYLGCSVSDFSASHCHPMDLVKEW